MKTSLLNRALLGGIAALAGLHLGAQTLGHGTVTGSLRDGDTQEPIPFTSVVVLRAHDHSLAAVGTTDAAGNFRLSYLPLGEYVVQTTALGYRLQQPAVRFRPLHNHQQLGTLTLQSVAAQPGSRAPREAVARRTSRGAAAQATLGS